MRGGTRIYGTPKVHNNFPGCWGWDTIIFYKFLDIYMSYPKNYGLFGNNL